MAHGHFREHASAKGGVAHRGRRPCRSGTYALGVRDLVERAAGCKKRLRWRSKASHNAELERVAAVTALGYYKLMYLEMNQV